MKAQILALVAVSALLTGCTDSDDATSMNHGQMNMNYQMPTRGEATPAPMGGTFLNEPLPADVLAVQLVDQSNHKFKLSDLKGKTLVITNFLTSCQEICPMTTVNMRDIAASVDASALSKEIEVLEITVDPKRDIPSRLSAYQDLFNDNRWSLVTGDPAGITKIWDFFGAPATREMMDASESMPMDWQTGKPNTYDMMHADLVVIVGPEGNWLWLDLGAPKTKSGVVPPVLNKFLSEQGKKNLISPQEPSWTVDAVLAALGQIIGKDIPVAK
jgi:protein SCO1/2